MWLVLKIMEEKISVDSTQSKYKLCLMKLLFALCMFRLHALGWYEMCFSLWAMVKSVWKPPGQSWQSFSWLSQLPLKLAGPYDPLLGEETGKSVLGVGAKSTFAFLVEGTDIPFTCHSVSNVDITCNFWSTGSSFEIMIKHAHMLRLVDHKDKKSLGLTNTMELLYHARTASSRLVMEKNRPLFV